MLLERLSEETLGSANCNQSVSSAALSQNLSLIVTSSSQQKLDVVESTPSTSLSSSESTPLYATPHLASLKPLSQLGALSCTHHPQASITESAPPLILIPPRSSSIPITPIFSKSMRTNGPSSDTSVVAKRDNSSIASLGPSFSEHVPSVDRHTGPSPSSIIAPKYSRISSSHRSCYSWCCNSSRDG